MIHRKPKRLFTRNKYLKKKKKKRNKQKRKMNQEASNEMPNSLPNIEVIKQMNFAELEKLTTDINNVKADMKVLLIEKQRILDDIKKVVKTNKTEAKAYLREIEEIESKRLDHLLQYNKKIKKTESSIKKLTKEFLKR